MCDLYTALTANDGELLNRALTGVGVSRSEATDAVVRSVCEDIDTLTFRRITDFFELTQFQRDTLVSAFGRFLRFKLDNAELLDTILRSYSINGVSMSFDERKIKCISGVYISGDAYGLLSQTGLTCRVI